MSLEEKFVRCLNRSEVTFRENLNFAIRAWQSYELNLSTKYERIIEWLTTKTGELGSVESEFPAQLMNEFLKLYCPPGLIGLDVKEAFVEEMVKWAEHWKDTNNRKPVEVLYGISELEMMQDLFRTKYDVYAKLCGELLKSYETYLLACTGLKSSDEIEFFQKILDTMKSRVNKAGNPEEFELMFTKFTLQPMVQVNLLFQNRGIRFFDDLLEIGKSMFKDYVETDLMGRLLKLPTHVSVVGFECAMVNYRGDVQFFQKMIKIIFGSMLEGEMAKDPALKLTMATYVLEMFKKHDILLNFPVTANQNALQYFGDKVTSYVTQFQDEHLLEVLELLCATLRLNPLILEKSVFDITAKIMVAKKDADEQAVFEEYMQLLMDMFKKLSRAEKFVASLQKSVKGLLNTYKIPKKAKRKRTLMDPQEVVDRKKVKLENGLEARVSSGNESKFYLQVLFRDFHPHKEIESDRPQAIVSFPHIAFAWPTTTVGHGFSKLIAGLMSKPSMVIWKSLVYALMELIEATTVLDDNTLFLFDFYSSLICQYLVGCKLPEQSDKHWDKIEVNRQLTHSTLQKFGQFLLIQEHNNRTMNAFLECCYNVSAFDLLLWYYRPDFMTDDAKFRSLASNLHAYLTDDEWVLIQQRIINFGRVECKFNANRLLLQQIKGKVLFQNRVSVDVEKFMLAPAASDIEQTKLIFSCSDGGAWLLSHMGLKEKQEICEVLVQDLSCYEIGNLTEDVEALEIIALELYRKLGLAFQGSKKAILHGLDFDADVDVIAKAVVEKKDEYTVKKLEVDSVTQILEAMLNVPIGCCRKEKKELFFVLQLAVYRDLKAAGEASLAAMAFDMLTDILHFGQPIQISKYLPIDRLLDILPPSSAKEVYEFIFLSLRHDVDAGEKFLEAVDEILKRNESALSDDHVKLLLMSIDALSQNSTHKRLKKFLTSILGIYASHVNTFFAATDGKKLKKDKKFVEKTLPGFVAYMNTIVNKSTEGEELDENFRKICKIYIGYSMDCHNPHAIKLITMALTNRAILHFDQDEIEFVLNSYWEQLNEDLKASRLDEKTAESVIKIIISNKTNEDFLRMLMNIGKDIAREDFAYICRLMALMAKCPLSIIKGGIFNEHFKCITMYIHFRLKRDDQYQLNDHETVLSLLQSQKAFAENAKIIMSYDTIDDILTFLSDINIKDFPVGDSNVQQFNDLHLTMTGVLTALIKNQHMVLMDRVPMFMNIYEDLLKAVCWYKSDRQKDTALTEEELDNLEKLADKLTSLMGLVTAFRLEVSRVAPYVLMFAINLMVSNKRPTTLYPKIKTCFEVICSHLLTICDHRVGRFILRCSNDAGKRVYEALVKEHKTYHKFKGKV